MYNLSARYDLCLLRNSFAVFVEEMLIGRQEAPAVGVMLLLLLEVVWSVLLAKVDGVKVTGVLVVEGW